VEYFTVRNTVILALAQVGVIVAGVLGGGATVKWYATMQVRPPAAAALVAEHGHFALALPLFWAGVALYFLHRERGDEDVGWLVFLSGLALLLLLVVVAGYCVAAPFLRLFGGSSGVLSA
jgi:hypothetical protein